MSTQYDHSGKIFSHVISKVPVKVVIQTKTSKIEGDIYKKHNERVLDAVNDGLQFIAVTKATIHSWHDGIEITREDEFVIVNRDTIDWIVPMEEQS